MNSQHLVKTAQDSVLNLAWQLPHRVRRDAYRKLRAGQFEELQALREVTAETDYGLAAFDEHQCIFVHIPKCAGISVSRSLFGGLVGTHMAIKTFQLVYSEADFERYFKFSIVRNPWDRLHSAYRFLRQGGLTEEDRVWAEQNLFRFETFEDFVTGWVTPENVNSWQHFKPQHRFTHDPKGAMPLDFVGRFETLDEDFRIITERLQSNATLDHHNQTAGSPKNDYRAHYSDETLRIVGEVYRRDVELFGYTFDSFNGRPT